MPHLNYYPANDITFTAAQGLLNVGIETAVKQKIAVSIAVVDRAGQLVAFGKMDDAPPISISVAEGKARTSAVIQDSTELFESMINRGAVAMLTVPDRVPLKGVLPLYAGGEIIGAVGVSGSTGEGDLGLAKHIVAAL